MNFNPSDPLLQTVKCNMCTNNVTNFVVGLCERCFGIWTQEPRIENMNLNVELVRAVIVRMCQGKTNYESMHEAFRNAIWEEHRKQAQKNQLFNLLREKFQESILLREQSSCCANRRIDNNEENFRDVPLPGLDGVDLTFSKPLVFTIRQY